MYSDVMSMHSANVIVLLALIQRFNTHEIAWIFSMELQKEEPHSVIDYSKWKGIEVSDDEVQPSEPTNPPRESIDTSVPDDFRSAARKWATMANETKEDEILMKLQTDSKMGVKELAAKARVLSINFGNLVKQMRSKKKIEKLNINLMENAKIFDSASRHWKDTATDLEALVSGLPGACEDEISPFPAAFEVTSAIEVTVKAYNRYKWILKSVGSQATAVHAMVTAQAWRKALEEWMHTTQIMKNRTKATEAARGSLGGALIDVKRKRAKQHVDSPWLFVKTLQATLSSPVAIRTSDGQRAYHVAGPNVFQRIRAAAPAFAAKDSLNVLSVRAAAVIGLVAGSVSIIYVNIHLSSPRSTLPILQFDD